MQQYFFKHEQKPSASLIAFDWWCNTKRQITRQTAALVTKSHRFRVARPLYFSNWIMCDLLLVWWCIILSVAAVAPLAERIIGTNVHIRADRLFHGTPVSPRFFIKRGNRFFCRFFEVRIRRIGFFSTYFICEVFCPFLLRLTIVIISIIYHIRFFISQLFW